MTAAPSAPIAAACWHNATVSTVVWAPQCTISSPSQADGRRPRLAAARPASPPPSPVVPQQKMPSTPPSRRCRTRGAIASSSSVAPPSRNGVIDAASSGGAIDVRVAVACTSSPTTATAELVVIGSGIVGAATALCRPRRTLSGGGERRPALCSLTTAVAAGGYRLQLEHREELDLVRRSAALFEDSPRPPGSGCTIPACAVRAISGWLGPTTRRQPGAAGRAAAGWGRGRVELLDGDEARRRFCIVRRRAAGSFPARRRLIEPKRIAMGLLEGSGASVVTGCG